MDHGPVGNAAEMPILYRLLLDRIAELEEFDRPTAARIRRAAIQSYSSGWDGAAYGRLGGLASHLQDRLERHRKSGRDQRLLQFEPPNAVVDRRAK
jgi:hypothetical protein